ncbi:UNVERIFIED_ORG: O-antigen/teichoic acid export membrane protein [Rhizobium sophorae]|uniref:oligosaccharide flippase family protein n=1 Tax=Rhizobium leguminosarum TaxID=384 RepID=UPI00161A291B|nr:oligosaccharide flippase family protein [Rhizobium leguminosarum]MBB4526526.1 PST family polysaccharide transporter [Rhizobium leguminosarum]MDH6663651.1 O-antigen/teichoic acid export membrane protein [Rhizobium sophorae]
MSSKAKVLKGFTMLVGGRVGSALISVLSTAILARLLSPDDFGLVSAALVVLALANVIFDGAFGVSLIKKQSVSIAEQRTTLTVAMLLSLVLIALIVLLSPQIGVFFRSESVGDLLYVAALTIPFKAIFAVSSATLQRDSRFGSIAVGSLVGQIFGNVLVAVPMALWGFGPWALVVGMVLAGAMEAAIVAGKAKMSLRPQLEKAAFRDLTGSALFSLANVMNWVANTGANAVVGRSMGFYDLGIYSRGWKLLDLVVGITATPLSRVLLPAFASRRDDPVRLAASLRQAFHLAVPAYACMSVFLVVHAQLIVYAALGAKWDQTILVAQFFFAALVPRCAFKISENFAVAAGRSGAAVVRQFIYAALMVGGAVLGLRYGVSGVALMTSGAVTIFYIISISFALRIGNMSPLPILWIHCKAGILAALIATVDSLLVWTFSEWPLILRHGVGGAGGAIVMLALLSVAPAFWLGPAGESYIPRFRQLVRKINPASVPKG